MSQLTQQGILKPFAFLTNIVRGLLTSYLSNFLQDLQKHLEQLFYTFFLSEAQCSVVALIEITELELFGFYVLYFCE